MIKIENTRVVGWEDAIRGMRNPMNSWDRSDTEWELDYSNEKYLATDGDYYLLLGSNDQKLMLNLAKAGPVHAKYRRMIVIYCDILAPLYWWKEFDTYKVGTVANSCSTMHKIHEKEFELDDFSHEHLSSVSIGTLFDIIKILNKYRDLFLKTDDTPQKERYWWQMIQLLPSSYNQRRTIMLNYEVLHNIYKNRKDHKLDEWRYLCNDWIKSLPFNEIITLEKESCKLNKNF